MAFWGLVLKPGQKQKLELPENEILHLSQACLHEPSAGKNYLQVHVQGTTYNVACLEKDKKEHDSFDLFFTANECEFTCKGQSGMHLLGYLEPERDGEGSEEEFPLPAKVAPKARPEGSPKQKSMDAAKGVSPKMSAAVAAAASPKQKAASPKQKASAPPGPNEEEDLSDFLEEGEESEMLAESDDEEEEEESDEEPPPPKKAGGGASSKMVVAEQPKRKGSEDAAAGAPTKKAKSGAGEASSELEGYVQKLVDYLKQNGKTPISLLGSKVNRPKTLPKLGQILGEHKDKFSVSNDSVEVK